jgi:hypothetical protein
VGGELHSSAALPPGKNPVPIEEEVGWNPDTAEEEICLILRRVNLKNAVS